MSDDQPRKLSTSALAKAMELPSQQLFSTLKDYGWIRKLDEGWALTSKGEFEGGEYVRSQRFGRYIVWPPEVAQHPLLQALEDNRHLSASSLAKQQDLSAREVNRILAELGWISHEAQGWELTKLGEEKGGVVMENDNSGTFYVLWPQSILKDSTLAHQFRMLRRLSVLAEGDATDLFTEQPPFVTLDGHQHDSTFRAQVCQWLYLAGFAHATQRRLPIEEEHQADFYLPQQKLYIECWDKGRDELAAKLRRKEIYQQLQLSVIDLEPADREHLDEVLTRELRKRGIRVY